MADEAADFFAATFSIEEEDHTLANSLRFFLNKKWVKGGVEGGILSGVLWSRGHGLG